jgi:hypothetical protein
VIYFFDTSDYTEDNRHELPLVNNEVTGKIKEEIEWNSD